MYSPAYSEDCSRAVFGSEREGRTEARRDNGCLFGCRKGGSGMSRCFAMELGSSCSSAKRASAEDVSGSPGLWTGVAEASIMGIFRCKEDEGETRTVSPCGMKSLSIVVAAIRGVFGVDSGIKGLSYVEVSGGCSSLCTVLGLGCVVYCDRVRRGNAI